MTGQPFDIRQSPFGDEDHDREEVVAYVETLMQRFSRSPEFEALMEEYPEMWTGYTHHLFDYLEDYGPEAIDAVDAGFLHGLLLRFFPRAVADFEAVGEEVVAEYRAFFEFLGREFGLDNAEDCLEYLSREDLAEEFDEAMSDPSNYGMGKSIVLLADRSGYNISDEDELARFITNFNESEMGAELFSGGFGGPPAEEDELLGMPIGDMEPPGRQEVLEAYDGEPRKRKLLARLIDAGEALPDELWREFVDGDGDVEALLIDVVEDEFLALKNAPGGGWAAIYAVDALGERGGQAALDALVDVFPDYQFDEIIYSHTVEALQKIGEPAMEPVLELWETSSDQDTRWGCADVLSRLGVRDDRILEVLMEVFDEDIVLGACYLGNYGDPAALARLHTEFERIPLDESGMAFANQEFTELALAIESAGGELTAEEKAKLDRADELRRRVADPLRAYAEALGPGREPYRKREEEKRGRNEPCWCGSGKKYKRCHWRQERR